MQAGFQTQQLVLMLQGLVFNMQAAPKEMFLNVHRRLSIYKKTIC